MAEMKISEDLKRRTAGHGYSAGCECDLVGGDPECTIQPPYETERQYFERLIESIATLRGMTLAAQVYQLHVEEKERIDPRVSLAKVLAIIESCKPECTQVTSVGSVSRGISTFGTRLCDRIAEKVRGL